ncbi:MAG: alpha-glucosidase [Bacteroidales bacterium]|nr:alpha-glucosidase [Bacteroidales bacterium]MCL2132922.1 alpha-glucosidase [Bacteroidales bacterium]
MQNNSSSNWWKHGVVYHIYPQSFKDSNHDGIGDIPGIITQLDYIADLGVDAIWLSPIYPSPMVDAGYDIANHRGIDAQYGTMNDFQRLLNEAHRRGLRVIMDLVLNHTSDQHPWFIASKSSVNNPKRDWYIWQPPKKGKQPNNWITNFGKKAWRYDPNTKEYYFHSFFWEQPDLNWRNPEVKKAMFDIIHFWLEAGVDGFRLDIINLLFKDRQFKNNKIGFFVKKPEIYNRNQPEVYPLLKEFRTLLDSYPEKTSVGEIYTPPPGRTTLAVSFLGNGVDMLHLVFDFSLIFTIWNAAAYYKTINRYYRKLPEMGWPCFFLSNHDIGRSIKRLGRWTWHKYAKAKLHAVLLLTLKGTPFIYYGDEIGMENIKIPKKYIQDLYGKIFYPFFRGRDRARTPMQWNSGRYAGFSTQRPWLPVSKDYSTINVEAEQKDYASILNLYKRLLLLRKKHTALHKGNITFLTKGKNNLLIYTRTDEQEKIFILLNFSNRKKKAQIGAIGSAAVVLLSTHHRIKLSEEGVIMLQAFEGLVIKTTLLQ